MAIFSIVMIFLLLIVAGVFGFGFVAFKLDGKIKERNDKKILFLLFVVLGLFILMQTSGNSSFNFGYAIGGVMLIFVISSLLVLLTQKIYKTLRKPINNRSILYGFFVTGIYLIQFFGRP